MQVLELFAGSRSIGKAAEELGMKVFSTDIEPYDGIDHVGDVRKFNFKRFGHYPDIIWASPPCTGFSVASIGHHWTGGKSAYIPKSDTARLGIELLECTIEIIRYWEFQNPKLIFFIENPRGVMRKMAQLKGFKRHTVTYCQYGDERMKPTDIWTNSTTWQPKSKCKNGSPCHVAAPRGSKTGTQGRANAHERSKIPHELCLEIMKSCL